MRIAIVRNSYSYLNVNAYNVQEIGLAKALVKKNSDIFIDIFFANNKFKSECVNMHPRITMYYLPALKLPANMAILFGLFKRLSKKKYALIQTGGDFQLMSVFISIYAGFFKIPLVLFQGMYNNYTGIAKRLLQKVYDLICLPILRMNTRLTLCKTTAAKEYIAAKGFTNSEVVGIGFDQDGLYPATHSKNISRMVLYVGVLEPRRNPGFILQLARALRNDNINFVVIGRGPSMKDFLDGIKENQLSNITHLEFVSQKELYKFYQNADVFILPTNYEIFGVVMLEALYYGVPIISTDNAGARDIIQCDDVGFIIKDLNVILWAEKIISLCCDQERLLILRENCLRSSRKYTWDNVAEKYLRCFRFVASC
jgi:glycosyltransferase involved in cell wall biosynthesis